jgi:HEAT repeats
VLLLDNGRTWSDDVNAGVRPGDRIYYQLIDEVSRIRGKTRGSLWSQEEDWTSRPGDLLLSLRMKGGKKQLVIPAPGPYLSAAVFTGLNDLTPAGAPRLWFADQGAPLGVVTRATAGERAALQEATGLRLEPEPPDWWTSLAPLPADRQAAPPSLAAARPPGRTSARPSQASGEASGRGSGGRKRTADGQPTARAAFERMMRELITPALHELGFTSDGTRWFNYRRGDYSGGLWTRKSRYSTRQEVQFWVNLGAAHDPTASSYWDAQLDHLMPGGKHPSHWAVRADSPAEPVAADLLTAFRAYGWPAIQAAVDDPGYPPDLTVTWPRSFGPQATPAALDAAGPNLGPLAWPVHRTGRRDDLFADLTNPGEWIRAGAVTDLGLAAGRDPDILAAVLNRLQHDPSAAVRSAAAAALRPLARQPDVAAELRAAAAQDEDLNVRWEARYALRLATPLDQ